jgi:mRNA interferase MazF
MAKPAFRQGDIVLLPFPYTDLSSSKKRPAVILSKDSVNKNCFIVAAITSVIRNDLFSFSLSPAEMTTPLPKPSEARTNLIFSAHPSLILKTVSSLKRPALLRLTNLVKENLEVV